MFKWLKEWGEEVKDRFQAVVPGYFGGDLVSEGIKVNPVGGTVMFDTGELSAGIYNFTIFLAASANWGVIECQVQHRNKANDTTLRTLVLCSYASMGTPVCVTGYKICDSERLRLENIANETGILCATCIYTRVFPLKRGQ